MGAITDFGTINLVYDPPDPPAEPVIDEVHVSGESIAYYQVEYDVAWDTDSIGVKTKLLMKLTYMINRTMVLRIILRPHWQ